jgi:SPP1 gp7 family putative phage head morphogenesis protein
LPPGEISKQLTELYNHACCNNASTFANLADDDLQSILEEMVRDLYRLQGTDGSINAAMTQYYADKMWRGVVKGYGSDIPGVDYDSPDFNMLNALKTNVSQFSAAKNYAQLKELSLALLDENGNLREFDEFKKAAAAINEKFVKTWLRTEYDLAVAGGQMAGKWVDIIRNKETLPLLQFEAVIDGRTTELCAGLNGTILPVGHAFWNRFYPPNHFNCRSTVRQLASGVVTPDNKIPSADIPKMFQTNLGKNSLIFPEDHPYFIGLPEEIKNRQPL